MAEVNFSDYTPAMPNGILQLKFGEKIYLGSSAAYITAATAGAVEIVGTTIGLTGTVDTDVTFLKEVARVIKVDASTTADTAGAALTVQAGAGVGTGIGGNLSLDAGLGVGAAADGQVLIGAANTLSVTVTPNTTFSADVIPNKIEMVDAKIVAFGSSDDVTLTYDGTDNVLDEALGTAYHSQNVVMTATAQTTEGRIVEITSSSIADATADTKKGFGICRVGGASGSVTVAISGTVPGKADGIIARAGMPMKTGTGGRACEMVNTENAGSTIVTTAAGSGFANQPANQAIHLVSDSAADTQNAIVYGTTNGTDTVVVETKALNGVTPVTTSKTDWGEILAIELSVAATGTITAQEAGANATITTIAPLASSVGVHVVAAGAAARAFNRKPMIVCSSTGTKQIGLVGTNVDYSSLTNNSKNLNGATNVEMATAMNTVTKVLIGDLEAARTVTVLTNTVEDGTAKCVGFSLGAAATRDDAVGILIFKQA